MQRSCLVIDRKLTRMKCGILEASRMAWRDRWDMWQTELFTRCRMIRRPPETLGKVWKRHLPNNFPWERKKMDGIGVFCSPSCVSDDVESPKLYDGFEAFDALASGVQTQLRLKSHDTTWSYWTTLLFWRRKGSQNFFKSIKKYKTVASDSAWNSTVSFPLRAGNKGWFPRVRSIFEYLVLIDLSVLTRHQVSHWACALVVSHLSTRRGGESRFWGLG